MIQANELRIGNLLQGQSLIIPRLSLSHTGVIAITAFGIYSIEKGLMSWLKPIHLTEEWLLKLGFVNRKLEYFDIESDNHAGYGILFRGHLIAGIEYVHELQNIYWALTQTELTCTL